jgi:glycosyltransferase involved in cell wall biosynthesis
VAGRLTIGLRFKHQDAWTGGVHYVRNLVSALGLLAPEKRPRLVVIGGDAEGLEELKTATGYPELRRLSRSRLEPAPAPRLPFARPQGEEIALILMGSPPGLEGRGVHWVPDFQEHRFPEFFDGAERASRHRHNAVAFARHSHVMVSSEDVAADLRRYYPQSSARVHVVRFAAFLPAEALTADVEGLGARYGLPGRYLICANQLWRHKNHAVILRALALAGDAAPTVAFTGKEHDHRDPDYGAQVRALAEEQGVEAKVRFLGFLPRADQLGLMRGALATLQPSLCEGWSTVVEDAKALGRHVLASDIAVHREQLPSGADFFEPNDAEALAALLVRYAKADPPPVHLDYETTRRRFSEDLWRMILQVERDLRRRRVDRLVIKPSVTRVSDLDEA